MVGFSFQIIDIEIGHDNSGFSPDWFLDSVKVEVGSQGKTYIYDFYDWLNDENGNSVPLPPTSVENTGKSKCPGPSCSKLTMLLVNVMLKFQTYIHKNTVIFCRKM